MMIAVAAYKTIITVTTLQYFTITGATNDD
jgi:hypothetical protein